MKSVYDKVELLTLSKCELIELIELEEAAKLRMEGLATVLAARFGALRNAVIEMINVTDMDFLDEDELSEKMTRMCECAESSVLLKPGVKCNAPGGAC